LSKGKGQRSGELEKPRAGLGEKKNRGKHKFYLPKNKGRSLTRKGELGIIGKRMGYWPGLSIGKERLVGGGQEFGVNRACWES